MDWVGTMSGGKEFVHNVLVLGEANSGLIEKL